MFLKITKAQTGKLIVEKDNEDPIIYDGVTEMVTDLFYNEIANELRLVKTLTLHTNIIFNPPIAVE